MALVRNESWNLLARVGIKGTAAVSVFATIGLAALPGQQATAAADDVTRYSATTTNLDPDGVTLRFDVLNWSDEDSARAVVAALDSDAVQDALDELPTLGYIWPDGSPVGYSVKFASAQTADTGERLTFVTSKPLGSYEFGGWTVRGETSVAALEYSVIELDVAESGDGTGMASLATPVAIDAQANTISLDRDGGSLVLFVDVHRIERGYN